MGGVGFHAAGRDHPKLLIEIEFRPARLGNLGAPQSAKREQIDDRLERMPQHWHSAEQRAPFAIREGARAELSLAENVLWLKLLKRLMPDPERTGAGDCPAEYSPRDREHALG